MYRFARIALGLAVLGSALLSTQTASASKVVQLKLQNDSPDKTMTCKVHRILPSGSESHLKTYTVKPKNQVPASQRGKPVYRSLRVSYVVKPLRGPVVYPKLRMTCKLSTPNTEQRSPAWDDKDKSFAGHRLKGVCSPGRYCSLSIERR